jgi:poly(glycerol-phosphate) alpha-glucosyltransferase
MGRYHPKKGIEEIIQALYEIKRSDSNLLEEWRFMVYGWGRRNYSNHIKLLVKKKYLDRIVFINDAVFGDDKLQILQHANAFILPSKSEGFPIAVLEAWVNKLPTLITSECNLEFSFINNSAIKIHFEFDKLKNDLISFFKKDENEIKNYGTNAFNMVRSEYNWDNISNQYIELYKSLM